ncbi:MAG: Serine protease [Marteilia pararefringens]
MNGEIDYLRVKIGEHRLDQKDRSEREYGVASVHMHPQYDRKSVRYDIALMKLDDKVKFDANISPVCLAEAETDLPLPGTKCFVTGWGMTEMQSQSNKLREVDLKLISQDVCKQSDFNKTDIKDDMICARNVEGGKGPCKGDSGGPLIYLDPKNGKWTQIGITSWTRKCEYSDHPSVFQRVDISKEWIEEIINEN